MSVSSPEESALGHPGQRSTYPQRIADVPAADAPRATGTAPPTAPASAVAPARNAVAGGPWRRPRRAGDRRRVDANRRSTPPDARRPRAGAPPPWTAGPDAPAGWPPDAADTRPFWRRIPAGWLIAVALVLVGPVAGWYFDRRADRRPARSTSRATSSARRPAGRGLFRRQGSVRRRVEDVKAVPCTTEHEFEALLHRGDGRGQLPDRRRVRDYVTQNCNPAFGAYIGKAYDDSDLDYNWLAPTDDAWRSGDRTVQCAAYHPQNLA